MMDKLHVKNTTTNGSVVKTFAEKMIAFNRSLVFDEPLPAGIRVMNPFAENDSAMAASSAFYCKYYNDVRPRTPILGINPGRFGAGLTGIPFTDPKRLKECCNIDVYQQGESTIYSV